MSDDYLAVSNHDSSDPSFESHSEYARTHERYKNVSLQNLGIQISERLAHARQGIAQHTREFNERGGRRYGPAMAVQSGREDAQEARLLKLYLELRVEKAEMIRALCLFVEEELTGDALEIDAMIEPTEEMLKWNPIEYADGQTGEVSWRILRYNWDEEVKTREYGPLDYAPCAPGSTYVYADNSAIRVKAKQKKAKAVLRPRVGPGALAAILADNDE